MLSKIWILPALCALVPLGHASDHTERAKIQGLTTAASDWLGVGLATDGQWTVTGSPNQNRGSVPGKAHVFQGCGSIAEFQELVPSDGFAGDGFGYRVALDDDRIVVGAPAYFIGTGAAYVFRFDGIQWVQEQKLTAFDAAVGDAFGRSVDIQDDLIVIGAPEKLTRDGAVYFYRFDGNQWNFEQKAVYGVGGIDPRYGSDVCIDGDLVAIAAVHFGWGSGRPNSGLVETLRHVGGGAWAVESVILNPGPQGTNSYFGASIALEGNRMLVTAPGRDDPSVGAGVGSLHAYEWINGGWLLQQTLVPSDAAAGDNVGWDVAVDGDVAVVSAYHHDSAAVDAGCAYFYYHDGTLWVEGEKVVASDAQAGDRLFSVDLAGGMMVAGAYQDDDKGTDSGSLYVFAQSFRTYGGGVAGAGALMPGIDATGTPFPLGTITLQVRDFVGGALACYGASLAPSSMPFRAGLLLIDPTRTIVMHGFVTPGNPGDPGAGDIDFSVMVPAGSAFQCVDVYTQAFAIDPAAPGGVSMTNGVHVYSGIIPPIPE